MPGRESDLIIYTTANESVSVGVLIRDETAWLSQKAIAKLFGVGAAAVAKHLKNIFESGELDPVSTVSKMETVQTEGSRRVARTIDIFDLNAIIAVGYRVNSYQATQFRIWATDTLRDFMIKGFALDDERMKHGKNYFGHDYFDELLERIREIRASERRFYQKIADIYALSVDYDRNAVITREFFATVQNKLHWAITGQTAAEIIYSSADATKIHMGLKTWKDAPHGKVYKSDVAVAKNYLPEELISELNRIVSAYLDLAENRAKRHTITRMAEWADFLDGFLQLSSYPILTDHGKISALEAQIKAHAEYDIFRKRQDAEFVSDLDRAVEETRRMNVGHPKLPTDLPGRNSKRTPRNRQR